ncbi:ATPase Na K transporting alpha [Coelomomyces lativittatus]|nr:ATPase Na K transporting alpha [Coelomomyces lativittatus]KAJ1499073.1 ATPase Na K transporting alpha [Coelomomyces lativittatus]KAJ1503535.1 ATPase Na K transporting alpha [Coelomomyces lativittatus]
MATCQFGSLLAVQNRSASILESNPLWGPRQNLVIVASMIGSICVCLIFLYGYWIQVIFVTAPIPVKFWFISFAFAALILIVDEACKAVVRAYPKSFLTYIA